MAAAFELSRPQHRGRYEVTVYQLGWRLGGKGASGRGPANRIEEHGFHVWLGFYENAFRMMRECYAELARDRRKCRVADWRDAFVPAPFIGMADPVEGNNAVDTLLLYFPPIEGFPGDSIGENNPFSINSYMARMASVLRSMMTGVRIEHGTRSESPFPPSSTGAQSTEQREQLAQRIARMLRLGALATMAGFIEALGVIQTVFTAPAVLPANLVQLLEALASAARSQLERLVRGDRDLTLLWHSVDLGLTCMLGILRGGLMTDPRGFDAINDYDFREWLRLNGASEGSINSPIVRCAYDIAFAYEDGDYQKPRHGAGVGLRGSLRLLFTYRGAIVWKMTAGMGDIVFAPLYEVLKKRGVIFKFFHRLEQVKLPKQHSAGERSHVEALVFDVQAEVKGGGEYQPLIDVDGLPCWPSTPDYSQLVNGARLEREHWKFESHWDRRSSGTKTLRVGADFDAVVLGVGVGVLPHVCRDLIRRNSRWRDMVAHLKTVETQAFQLWMREDLESLGWEHPPGALTGFVQPFESWFDMGHLAREEKWRRPPKSIVYFCSTIPSADAPPLNEANYPSRRAEEVKAQAIRYLDQNIGSLWPNAVREGNGFRWDLLIDPREDGNSVPPPSSDHSRFDSQFWIANVDPTERYSLSLPGTQRYRISPLDNTYDNLTIAGDWTACGLDSGCVEAAVMSGRLAAHAISSFPPLEEIVGYDHP